MMHPRMIQTIMSNDGLFATALIKVERLKVVDSTNEELKRRIAVINLERPIVIAAEEQTAGRGRRGRTWLNSNGAVLMSIAVPLDGIMPECFPLVNHAAAVAVSRVLRELGADTRIKWPNDILIGEAKVCGILSDLVFDRKNFPCAIIGIGINANADSMPDGLMYPAVSLKLVLGHEVDVNYLIETIGNRVFSCVQMFKEGNARELLNDYAVECSTIGREITVVPCTGDEWSGFAVEIADDGRLMVRDDQGVMHMIDAADVSVRRDNSK